MIVASSGCQPCRHGPPELVAHERVLVRQPDGMSASISSRALRFQRAMPPNRPSSLSRAGSAGRRRAASPRRARVDHPLDDGVEQRRLGVEVVVEGAPRGAELVEHVLDAHLLVALGLDRRWAASTNVSRRTAWASASSVGPCGTPLR